MSLCSELETGSSVGPAAQALNGEGTCSTSDQGSTAEGLAGWGLRVQPLIQVESVWIDNDSSGCARNGQSWGASKGGTGRAIGSGEHRDPGLSLDYD